MTTWDRARAWRTIRSTLAHINDAWPDGGVYDAERFQQFDKLLAKAVKERDLERVELICQRYEAATLKDIQVNAQSELF